MAINFPDIDPYVIKLYGKIGITWYSLSYVTGILVGWQYALHLIRKTKLSISEKVFDDYITWFIAGMIIGGRLGYVILYDPVRYFSDPIEILKTYEGGMSFHGGLAGVIISILLFARYYKVRALELSDLLVQVAPVGIMLGRIANFINGELFGSVTTMPWGVIFPYGGPLPRHPSQIYESFLEGFVMFFLLRYCALTLHYYKKEGVLSGIFLIWYAIARSFCELYRIPDFISFGLTSGQLYSVPMILLGAYLIKRK